MTVAIRCTCPVCGKTVARTNHGQGFMRRHGTIPAGGRMVDCAGSYKRPEDLQQEQVPVAALSDPWATPDNPLGSQAPQPKWTTRADLIELAARALRGYESGQPWSADDLAPITTFGGTTLRDVMVDYATAVLTTAYPQVSTADEIEALGWMTVLVNDQGHVQERDVHPDTRNYGGKPWSQPGSDGGRHRVGWSSAELAVSGPWTVVHRRAS